MDWSGGKGMQETLSLALGFLAGNFAKKGETITERFLGFFGTDKVVGVGTSDFASTIPSW